MISETDAVPDLLIRDLPPDVHQRLKERAERNRRSLSAEVVALIEDAVKVRKPMSLEEIDARRVKGRIVLTDEILELARQDRR